MPFKSGRINTITSQPGGSVWCDDTLNVGRIFDGRLSYAKGAMILHTLRWVMGDSLFFAGMNSYLSDTTLRYNFATTDDFKNHMELAYGQSLTWYFNDWFTGQGYPSYQISWYQDAALSVHVTINQTQSHPSVPFFELPLPLKFSNGISDTTIVVSNTFSGETFSVPINFAANNLQFDPELWIISANNQVITGVNEMVASGNFTLNPNPAKDQINLITGNKFIGVEYFVTDAIGQTVLTSKIEQVQQCIDVSHLENGLYFISLGKAGSSFVKFIKQ